MVSLKKKTSGFTIVELLIVIVVIGILAALVVVTYNGIKQKDRDTKRKTDVKVLQGQLEAYWANNAKYPTMTQLNDSAFRSANMKGLDPAVLQDPKGSSQAVCASTSSSCYGYAATPSGCDNSTTDCDNYTLTATLESGGTFSIRSNN